MGRERLATALRNNCTTATAAEPILLSLVSNKKSYTGKVIITGLKTYSDGYSLQETSSKLNKRFKVKTTRNTVYNWVKEYRNICKLLADRKQYTNGFEPENLIREHNYTHSGLEYPYKIQNRKLELAEKHGFQDLSSFLKNIDQKIDHSIFEEGTRSSQVKNKTDFNIETKENTLTCELADLALKANNNRKKRHESVQDLMLKVDKATVATEVPGRMASEIRY